MTLKTQQQLISFGERIGEGETARRLVGDMICAKARETMKQVDERLAKHTLEQVWFHQEKLELRVSLPYFVEDWRELLNSCAKEFNNHPVTLQTVLYPCQTAVTAAIEKYKLVNDEQRIAKFQAVLELINNKIER